MTAIHLPGWKETIDLGQIPECEHELVCRCVAAMILQDLKLWNSELSLRDVLGGLLPKGSPLEILTSWVWAKLLEAPNDCEDLAGQVGAAYAHAEMRREWELEGEEVYA